MFQEDIYLLIYCILLFAGVCIANPLLLLNSTRIESLVPNTPDPDWRCYPRNAPFPLDEIKMADCRQLARDIANLDRSGKKWKYGPADVPGVEKTLPATFSRRTCITHIIDMESTRPLSDSFTMRYLSQKLGRMADMCVEPPPHLGGEGKIGAKEVLAIIVVGVAEPDNEGGLGRTSNETLERLSDDFVVTQGSISTARPVDAIKSL